MCVSGIPIDSKIACIHPLCFSFRLLCVLISLFQPVSSLSSFSLSLSLSLSLNKHFVLVCASGPTH